MQSSSREEVLTELNSDEYLTISDQGTNLAAEEVPTTRKLEPPEKFQQKNSEHKSDVPMDRKRPGSSYISSAMGPMGMKSPAKRKSSQFCISRKSCMKGKGGPENAQCSYRGVRQRTWGKWVAEIREPNKGGRLWLGTFLTAHEAALAYDEAAKTLYGSCVPINMPKRQVCAPQDSSRASPLDSPLSIHAIRRKLKSVLAKHHLLSHYQGIHDHQQYSYEKGLTTHDAIGIGDALDASSSLRSAGSDSASSSLWDSDTSMKSHCFDMACLGTVNKTYSKEDAIAVKPIQCATTSPCSIQKGTSAISSLKELCKPAVDCFVDDDCNGATSLTEMAFSSQPKSRKSTKRPYVNMRPSLSIMDGMKLQGFQAESAEMQSSSMQLTASHLTVLKSRHDNLNADAGVFFGSVEDLNECFTPLCPISAATRNVVQGATCSLSSPQTTDSSIFKNGSSLEEKMIDPVTVGGALSIVYESGWKTLCSSDVLSNSNASTPNPCSTLSSMHCQPLGAASQSGESINPINYDMQTYDAFSAPSTMSTTDSKHVCCVDGNAFLQQQTRVKKESQLRTLWKKFDTEEIDMGFGCGPPAAGGQDTMEFSSCIDAALAKGCTYEETTDVGLQWPTHVMASTCPLDDEVELPYLDTSIQTEDVAHLFML